MARQKQVPPLRINEWQEFVNENDTKVYSWYLQATDEIVCVLDKMAKKAESFEQLKTDLTKFVTDRKEFVKYGQTHSIKTQRNG